MKRIAYYDFFNNKLEEQVSLYKKSDESFSFVLRNIDGESFLKKHTDSYIDTLKLFNDIVVDLENNSLLDNYVLETIKTIEQQKEISAIILNIRSENTTLENINYVKRISNLYNKKEIILRFPYDNKAIDIKTFMDTLSLKNVKVFFSPTDIFLNRLSYTLEYRIIKKYVGFIKLSDIDMENTPALIGYGVLDLIDFFKRLYENQYQGYIGYDCNIVEILKHFDKEEKRLGSYKFRGKYKKNIAFFASKIKGNKDKNISMIEIFLNQIQVINQIFKL